MKKKRLLTDKSGKLHDEIVEQAAERMARDMDARVMQSMLKECGWAEVLLKPMTKEVGDGIDRWVESNIKKGVWAYGLVWMFKDPKEANWFAMRWL